jgi:4-amino-4-deoxy-L-arabinose transferase-like glycosyltransferase
LLWFAVLVPRPLFNPDEGRYAEIPREMLAGGDWVIPHLNGLAYIEKPPLQYWATAIAYKVFGLQEWVARLWTGLTGWLMVVLAYFAGRRLWGRDAGWRAGVICGSALMPFVMGHLLTLDTALSFFMVASVLAITVAQQLRQSATASDGWMLVAWITAACALLSKGLVGIVLPGAVFVLYTLWQRDFGAWRHLNFRAGLPAFLLIALPWHVLAQRRHSDFFDFYIVREHFLRFSTKIADRYEPWWFFIPVLLAGTLPWWPQLLRALCAYRRTAPLGSFDARRILWLWIAFVLVFFSASDSKLMPYILPVIPAIALLAAQSPQAAARRDIFWAAVLSVLVGAGLLAVALALPRLLADVPRAAYFLPLGMPLILCALLIAAGGGAAICWRMAAAEASALNSRCILAVGSGWFIALSLFICSANSIGGIYSGRSLATSAPESLAASIPVYSVRTYDQTLAFYWRRTLTLVDYRGELDHGLQHDSTRYIEDLAHFATVWRADVDAIAVMEPEVYAKFADGGLPMRMRGRDARRVVVSRR